MDFKDLMVGDLVYVVRGYDKHLTIEKIKGVIEDEDKPYPVTIFTGETVSLNDIEPIELTEDILVKNGFKKVNMTVDGDYRHYHLHGVCISWEEQSDFWYGEGDIEFKYVHQLQHLLRLCGIEKEIEL